MGSCIIPNDFSLFKLGKTGTPTMVMIGAKSIEHNVQDARAILKHYRVPEAKCLRYYKLAGDMPFIEENELFTKTAHPDPRDAPQEPSDNNDVAAASLVALSAPLLALLAGLQL